MVDELLEEARRDPNVLGVFLKGSRAQGLEEDLSDWDVVVVMCEGDPTHEKEGYVLLGAVCGRSRSGAARQDR